ncbi:hypothetical protein ACN3XK_73535 [Actinomadura welshii]
MDEQLKPWVLTTDPETIDDLWRRWRRLGPNETLEDYAHELGFHPNKELGQLDSIFFVTTADGNRYPVWEPGPHRRPQQSPSD